jgi:uncharacterized membrane protein (UPF0136 family)
MVNFANAVAIALLLTAGFALRFRYWQNPKILIAYFLAFCGVETIAGKLFLPENAMGIEVALVCLALTIPIVAAIRFVRRREAEADHGGSAESS